jgi:hypothetical protein
MTFGNCWIYAFRRWRQEGMSDTYITFRKSRHSWIWHAFWVPSISETYVEEYKPIDPAQGKLFRCFPFPALMFRGRVRKGWGEEGERTKVGR